MKACQWKSGIKVSGDQVLPVMTDLLVILSYLILSSTFGQFQLIIGLCQRKMSLPPCRKHSLECSPACGQCRGTAYTNSTHQFDYDTVTMDRDVDTIWAHEKPK